MIVKNIVVGQKYTAKDGQEKTKWTTIGAMFIKDDGKMSVKIEQIPLNWDGQAQVFDRDSQGQQQPQQQGGYSQPAPQQAPQQQYQQPQAPQQQQVPQFDQNGQQIPF